jgi:hypothetical protein
MLTVIRKNQQVLMLVIAILTIIAFIWLYNPTDKFHKFGSNDVISIYGRVVQRAEIDHQARGYRLALALGLTDFVRDLGGMGENEEASVSDFILNLFVIRNQAPSLGIQPSDDEVAGVIKGLPSLQTSGAFDPAKYSAFIQDQLAPNGFTERQMEEIVRDSLRVKELRRVITSPVAIGEGQVREAARVYQSVNEQVLRYERDAFAKNVTVGNEEVAAFYSKNKQGLISSESRDVTFVAFDLPGDQQKLTGKEKAAAQQKLADRAEDSAKGIRGEIAKGGAFAKAAQAASLHPTKVSGLQRDGSVNGKESGIPASVSAAAFRLQKSGELSDIIQDGNSFYVVSLDGITPSHQLELAEVSDKITTLLKQQKATKLLAEAASKSLDKIRADMTAGKSFADAAKAAGVKLMPLDGVTPSDQKISQEQQALASATLGLKDGQLGSLQPAPWGGFAVYLEKRTPLTEAQWKDHQGTLSKTILSNEQDLLFMDWLRSARAAAQLRMLGSDARNPQGGGQGAQGPSGT